MSLRYDAAFYVQVLDRYVATGECAEADNEPLYAYLLSVMNDPMIRIQVLSDEVCARIFYDAMSQFIRLNLEKQRYNMQKSQSEQQGMELALEWSEVTRKDGRLCFSKLPTNMEAMASTVRFIRGNSVMKGNMPMMKSGKGWWTTGKRLSNGICRNKRRKK